jgi:hypothetical protein
MVAVIKGIVQTTLRNDGETKIEINIKGVGRKVLYPAEEMRIDNGTRYTAIDLGA